MKFKEIISLLENRGFLVSFDESNLDIDYISYNSKDIKASTILFCKGINFKKEYLEEAIKKGATCYVSAVNYDVNIPCIIVNDVMKSLAVISHEFYKDDKKICLIGVTGTKGKTTTVSFINNMLNQYSEKETAYMGTIDFYTGLRREKSHNTTPESLDITKNIAEAKSCNIDFMTMEVSSQAHKAARIFDMNFNYGVWVNIAPDHISPLEHKDYDDYFNSKLGFLKQCQKIILFKHTDRYEEIIKELSDKEIITYGLTNDCTYYIKELKREDNITSFTVVHDETSEIFQISISGSFNALNALAAIIIGKDLNISSEKINLGLLKTNVEGRMNVFFGEKCPIIVDYAHNKLSGEALLQSITEEYPGKKIRLVFGSCGDRAYNRRKELGELAGEYASYCYLTADDPQTKTVFDICQDIIPYIEKENKPYKIIEDREVAVRLAISEATSNDIVVIIGKGDETYQIINHVFTPYMGDTNIVKEIVSKIKEKQ